MDDKERLANARKKAGQIRGFYTHLFFYVVVISGLAVINILTDSGTLWFIFPMLGWGIGILAHGWGTFYADNMFGKEWEDRKVREILAREEGGKPKRKEDYFEEGS